MSGIGKIVYVKISRTDGNGTDITNALESLETIVLPLSKGNKELNILNRTRENEYFLFYVSMAGTENIPAADKSSPNYSFSSSFQNQYDQPSDSSPNLTVTLDNHNFFLPGGTGLGLGPSHEPLDSYRITTLPAKNIGVHVSSSYNSFFQASGKYGSAHLTASVRILSSPLL